MNPELFNALCEEDIVTVIVILKDGTYKSVNFSRNSFYVKDTLDKIPEEDIDAVCDVDELQQFKSVPVEVWLKDYAPVQNPGISSMFNGMFNLDPSNVDFTSVDKDDYASKFNVYKEIMSAALNSKLW